MKVCASDLRGFDELELNQQIQVASVGIGVSEQGRAKQMRPLHLVLLACRLDGLKRKRLVENLAAN